MPRTVLGSYIAKYKYMYRNQGKRNSADILEIVDRLEKHKKYVDNLKKETHAAKKSMNKKTASVIKKAGYKKVYSLKPVINPYVEMILKAKREGRTVPIDHNLEKKYHSKNLYTLYEFRHIPLPRSDHEITAGQAWGGLVKAWKGLRASKGRNNIWLAESYAQATQKWSHMLELPIIPEFEDLDVTVERFEESLKTKILEDNN